MTNSAATRSNDSEPKRSGGRLIGILVTFRRPDAVHRYLNILGRQTVQLQKLIVVDNGTDPALAAFLRSKTQPALSVTYLDPGTNLGPAGGFRLGLDHVRSGLAVDDLVIHFDDDDPPVVDDQLERLVGTLNRERAADPRIVGVGLSGGNLNTRLGIVESIDLADGAATVDVDHLHGGYTPVYVGTALAAIDGNDPTFFFGFEELELGRRLRLNGGRLLVDIRLMREVASMFPKRTTEAAGSRRNGSPDPTWSRFHKERNLVRILRRERLWGAIGFTVLARHIGRPLGSLPRTPRASLQRVAVGLRATVAGLQNRGGIDRRYPPV